MAISKKALVFSLISILMSTLFILAFSALIRVPVDAKSQIAQTDVERTEQFLILFPHYFETAIEQATYETTEYLIQERMPVDNFSQEFRNCLMYGDPVPGEGPCSVDGDDHTLENLLNDIANTASSIYRGNCTTRVLDVEVYQEEPFRLTIYAEAKLIFQKGESLIWHIDYNVTKKVSLEGLTDPLTKDLLNRSIQIGVDDLFTMTEFDGDMSLINLYVQQGFYFLDPFAPSFINVLEGNITELTYNASKLLGLNSFIPDTDFTGLPTYKFERSFFALDYIRDTHMNLSDLVVINQEGLKDLTFDFYYATVYLNVSEDNILYADGDCSCDVNGCYCP